jgi:hypothetical protein
LTTQREGLVAELQICIDLAAREIDALNFLLLGALNTRSETRNRFYTIYLP